MPRKSKRRHQSKRRVRGGGAIVLPASYYKTSLNVSSAGTGHDLLSAGAPTDVRQRIGGKRRKLRTRKHKTTGGFVPSIMDGFVAAASRFIVPLALYSGYKLLSRKQKKQGRRTRRR